LIVQRASFFENHEYFGKFKNILVDVSETQVELYHPKRGAGAEERQRDQLLKALPESQICARSG
jgi:hypothetical protein